MSRPSGRPALKIPAVRARTLLLAAIMACAVAAPAAAVPASVPRIVENDGSRVTAIGRVYSPPSASNCTALVRAQLQVPSPNGWRAVRALGRHRVDVCEGRQGRWTYGDYRLWFGAVYILKPGPARLCVQATQTVNRAPSKHVSCKRFTLV